MKNIVNRPLVSLLNMENEWVDSHLRWEEDRLLKMRYGSNPPPEPPEEDPRQDLSLEDAKTTVGKGEYILLEIDKESEYAEVTLQYPSGFEITFEHDLFVTLFGRKWGDIHKILPILYDFRTIVYYPNEKQARPVQQRDTKFQELVGLI